MLITWQKFRHFSSFLEVIIPSAGKVISFRSSFLSFPPLKKLNQHTKLQQLGIISLHYCDNSSIFTLGTDSSVCLQKGCPASQPFCRSVHDRVSLLSQQIPPYHPERSDVDVGLFQPHLQINIGLSSLCSESWKGKSFYILGLKYIKPPNIKTLL